MSGKPRSSRVRRLRWLAIILAVTVGVLWGGYEWLMSAARARLTQHLAESGLALKYQGLSWSPWAGLTLHGAALYRTAADPQPVIAITMLHVDILWRDMWTQHVTTTRWRSSDSKLRLRDEQGQIDLENFSTDFTSREGKIEIASLAFRKGPLAFDLKGRVLPPAGAGSDQGPFELHLQPLRGVLEVLNFKAGPGAFQIAGSVFLDLRQSATIWHASLHGAGKDLEWRGLPLREAVANGEASQENLKTTWALQLMKGSAHFDLTQHGWENEPLNLTGTLTDSTGEADEFTARHDGDADTLTVSRLAGKANLVDLITDFPPLAADLPSGVSIKTFPDIALRDLVWRFGKHPATWSLSGLQFRSPASLVVTPRGHPLNIDHVTGQFSREEGAWHLEEVKGQLLGGSFGLHGNFDGSVLSKSEVSLKNLHLVRLAPWLGKINAKLDDSDLSLHYQGTICQDPARSTGTGTFVLIRAPVVHIPLLDQASDLFPKLIPRKKNDGTGECDVTFAMTKGIATVDSFKAHSESVNITGSGTVDLVKQQVSGRARANLRGVEGVITAPLSHVVGEMQVSGPFDDVRVAPLGPLAEAKQLFSKNDKAPAPAVGSSVKLSSHLLRESLTLPFEALGMFGKG